MDELPSEFTVLGYEMPDFPPTISSSSDKDNHIIDLFQAYIQLIREGKVDLPEFATAHENFIKKDGLLYVLTSGKCLPNLLTDIAKLPDLLSNAYCGQMSPNFETTCDRVAKNVSLFLLWCEKGSHSPNQVANLIDKFVLNFMGCEPAMASLVKYLNVISSKGTKMDRFMSLLGSHSVEQILRSFVKHTSSLEILLSSFSKTNVTQFVGVWTKILLARRECPKEHQRILVSFLAQKLTQDTLCQVFLDGLRLWGDPIIAKAYVAQEVIHYSRICVLLFHHIDSQTLQKYQTKIIETLVGGLPHHFHSADGRTVSLAKYFSELLTSNIAQVCNGESASLPEEVLKPSDDLCQSLIDELCQCPACPQFWFNAKLYQRKSPNHAQSKPEVHEDKKSNENDIESEDDLEPIETLEAPSRKKVVFLRQFLERFSEVDQFDETSEILESLPDVITAQLALEHPQTGQEITDSLFNWENKFEDPGLDLSRKRSLCQVIVSSPDSNIPHLCALFHQEYVQSYKKNMILDVLSGCSERLSLKDLQTLTRVSFDCLLREEDTLRRQDTVVQIPFVMYLTKLFRILPETMITDRLAGKYLKALTSLSGTDSATEQVVRHALNSVLPKMEHIQMEDQVQSGLMETRKWLIAIENLR